MTDTPLVVDALNFLTQYFMPVDKMPGSTPAWRLLAAMKVGVEGFLKACAASGFSPHFVIDAGYKSDEASQKWTKRREKECRTCLLYTSPSPRDKRQSRMPSSA